MDHQFFYREIKILSFVIMKLCFHILINYMVLYIYIAIITNRKIHNFEKQRQMKVVLVVCHAPFPCQISLARLVQITL